MLCFYRKRTDNKIAVLFTKLYMARAYTIATGSGMFRVWPQCVCVGADVLCFGSRYHAILGC